MSGEDCDAGCTENRSWVGVHVCATGYAVVLGSMIPHLIWVLQALVWWPQPFARPGVKRCISSIAGSRYTCHFAFRRGREGERACALER